MHKMISYKTCRIKLLPNYSISLLAAGKLIDRLACVLKEALENSLVADSKSKHLRLLQGRAKQLKLTDNAVKFAVNDLLMALTRSATNKLANLTDLKMVAKPGLQSQALANIDSVSRLHLRSRNRANLLARPMCLNVFKVLPLTPVAIESCTIIKLKNFYLNMPTRHKFLKAKATEIGHYDTAFKRISLLRPAPVKASN